MLTGLQAEVTEALPAVPEQKKAAFQAAREAVKKAKADGASGGKCGPAMQIYTDIRKASPRAKEGILHRLALGSAL
jgi:hypothetical protein